MKRNTIGSCLCAAALAFLLGFGGTMCMVTGLRLPAEVPPMAIGCALGALIPAICLCFRRGELALSGIATLFTLLLTFSARFQEQLPALCFSIMDYYHKGYGISIPAQIDGCTAESQLLPLLFIAGIVMVAVVWTVMRKSTLIPAVILAILPLASCLLVTDTVPDAMPIFLMMLGLVLLIMTQSVRRQNTVKGNRLTAILALPAIAALAVLFFLIPEDGYTAPKQSSSVQELLEWFSDRIPSLDHTSDGQPVISFGNNYKDQVDLSEIGNRIEQNTPVMEVTTDYTGTLYLRGRDYDVYTGLGWQASENRTETDYGPGSMIWQAPTQHAAIRLFGKHGQFYLPCYPTQSQTLNGGMIPNPAHISSYSYSFSPLRADWKVYWALQYGAAPPASTDASPGYQYLPDGTRSQALKILNQVNTFGASNTADLADAIADFVRQSATYDLSTGRMPDTETDFAIWFLESSDSGYCVHFATAATVLLRAAGIPARYVEGYTVSAQPGQATIVREKNAHAWVEYYLDYVGWVILDPTPGAGDPPVESTTAPTQPTETQPPATTAPTQPSSSTTAPEHPSETVTDTPSGTRPSSGGSTEDAPPQWFQDLLTVIFFTAVAAFLITAQWYLRRWLVLKKMDRGSINAQAITRYREAIRLSKLCRTHVPDPLHELAQKAKFSQHELTSEELKQFDRVLRDCTRNLQKQPWYCRLIHRFIFAAY